MNNTTSETPTEVSFDLLQIVFTTVGSGIFLMNLFIFVILVKLFAGSKGNRDKYGIVTHTMFVCFNDTASGFILLLLGIVSVKDDFTAHVCAYTIFISLVFQLISYGNITCICAQRYIAARNIRKLTSNRPSHHTKILLGVNVFLGLLSFVSFVAIAATAKSAESRSPECTLAAIVSGNIAYPISAYYTLGIVFLVLANFFCVMTIFKLKVVVNQAIQPDNMANSSSGSTENDLPASTRAVQQNAIITILVIVIFFNISVVPGFVGLSITYTGKYISLTVRRVFMSSVFVNSLFNPIIIATRVNGVRSTIIEIVSTIWNRFKTGFRLM